MPGLDEEQITMWGYWAPEVVDTEKVAISQLPVLFKEHTNQKAAPALYASLIQEEFDEWRSEYLRDTKELQLKELADMIYVLYGYADAKGWDLDEAVRRVHDNNIGRCTQPDGSIKRREDGKILKNKDYPKVNLEDLV